MIFRSKSTNLIGAIASCAKPNSIAMDRFQFVLVVTAKLNQLGAFVTGHLCRVTHGSILQLCKRLNPEHSGALTVKQPFHMEAGHA